MNNKTYKEYYYTDNTPQSLCDVIDSEIGEEAYSVDIRFSTSWDWLMPVVKQIRANKLFPKSFTIVIDENDKIKKPCKADDFLIQGLYTQDIDLVYKGVIEFIKWYNKQNKEYKK